MEERDYKSWLKMVLQWKSLDRNSYQIYKITII